MKRLTLAVAVVLTFGICSGLAYTIPAFEGGGHYFSQKGNPNDCGFYPANTWSAVACLHMLFDYWDHIGNSQGVYEGGLEGNMYPQEEIAHVANINDVAAIHSSGCDIYCAVIPDCSVWGTLPGDYVRALHFSKGSSSADGAVDNGYSWQQNDIDYRGYTAVLMNFNNIPEEQRFAKLKQIIDANYPLIAFIDSFSTPDDASGQTPPVTFSWHAVLVIGYQEGDTLEESFIEIHDPWFGANKHYKASNFFRAWNVLQGYPPQKKRLALFGAPWNRKIEISFPGQVHVDDEFTVTATVTYEADNLPFNINDYLIQNAEAKLTWTPSNGLELASGESQTKALPNISYPNTSDSASWRVVAKKAGTYSFTVSAGGTLTYTAFSYDIYQDEIGGNREVGYLTVLEQPSDDDTDDDASDDDDADDDDTGDDDTGDDDMDDDAADDDTGGSSAGSGCGGCWF